jgi:MoxR-like ATPase
MEESSVTVDGVTRRLPEPFGVIGTQNPVEHEGTYPLPHAELDRFMVKMALGYPDGEAEMDLLRLSEDPVADLGPVVSLATFARMRRLAGEVYASEAVLRYVVSVTKATRKHEAIYLGASPRASRMLLGAAKAHAAARGRSYCIPDDVKALAPHVLSHRIIVHRAGSSRNGYGEARAAGVVREILSSVPVNEAV